MKAEVGIDGGTVAVFAFDLEWRGAEIEDKGNFKAAGLEVIYGLHLCAYG